MILIEITGSMNDHLHRADTNLAKISEAVLKKLTETFELTDDEVQSVFIPAWSKNLILVVKMTWFDINNTLGYTQGFKKHVLKNLKPLLVKEFTDYLIVYKDIE